MEKIKLTVYANLNGKEEIDEIFAIKDNSVIKYIDLTNNKIAIDIDNNIMTRENSDYLFTFKFNENNIIVKLKSHNQEFDKEIKTLLIKKTKKSYIIRYLLIDENIINEYQLNF